MTELHFLHALLIVAMVIAPLATRLFLATTKLHDIVHLIAALLAAAALVLDIAVLSFAWLLFCSFAFLLLIRQRFSQMRSAYELAKCVPFVFSIIGATWLVSGANGFGLLGYGKAFSFYAALHGHFLGWMIVGGLAFLANEADRFNRFYLIAVFVCLASFLLIAFGIDGVPVIKPIGVFGITSMVGVSLILFLVRARRTSPGAMILGLVSFLGFAFTMLLAWQNELGAPPAEFLDTRGMVSLHGVVNGLVVAPCFVFALYLDRRATDSSERA